LISYRALCIWRSANGLLSFISLRPSWTRHVPPLTRVMSNSYAYPQPAPRDKPIPPLRARVLLRETALPKPTSAALTEEATTENISSAILPDSNQERDHLPWLIETPAPRSEIRETTLLNANC
jgi:hypothetical protein